MFNVVKEFSWKNKNQCHHFIVINVKDYGEKKIILKLAIKKTDFSDN